MANNVTNNRASTIITIKTPGPQGPQGIQGIQGETGPSGSIMNPATITSDIIIPSGYNALLVGPITQTAGNLIISASSRLTII